MENVKRLFASLKVRMLFLKLLSILTLSAIIVFMLTCKKSTAETEADYMAACKDIPVVELTNNSEAYLEQKVSVAGEVVVYEESGDIDSGTKNTILVIGVNDPSSALPSGKLPVLISCAGSTAAFINDRVTVYGEFYGLDTPELTTIQKKTLPRINAEYVIIETIE